MKYIFLWIIARWSFPCFVPFELFVCDCLIMWQVVVSVPDGKHDTFPCFLPLLLSSLSIISHYKLWISVAPSIHTIIKTYCLLDLPLLTLFSTANEPVFIAKFICLAAVPQIIVEHKISHGWWEWRKEGVGMNNFPVSHFYPERIQSWDRFLKLDVMCVIAFETDRLVCHMCHTRILFSLMWSTC